jgi:hypothetical protein
MPIALFRFLFLCGTTSATVKGASNSSIVTANTLEVSTARTLWDVFVVGSSGRDSFTGS